MESILTDVKKALGIAEDDNAFDTDLIMHINSVFMILTQLGVGSPNGYIIEDENNTWSEFISDDYKQRLVKSYIYLKVKLIFDPPLSSTVIASMERQINEFEWRLNFDSEVTSTGEEENQNGV